ncbi:hypothetical protein B0T14DRAFT_417389 [Immersiella caudata]|uniref:Uncharacterized protein n=1 Tax=Immersiella caudata TaxID=314043 RepID=A0AA40CDH3_9PEZI|nr:hypothetical protein B0T14DRAFT_417389 [Immersiella caudata]
MAGVFFLSWELWQQMTFALAMAILAVFFAGLIKLWWNTRLMKKQAVLDEEKKARVEEMRRTGLPLKRTNEIPFGVRALQRGVEVDGIWVSRPVSPNGTATTRKSNVRPEDTISTDGGQTPLSHFAPRPRRARHQTDTVLNEDTLRRLEGQPFPRTYDTYTPTSAPKNPRYPSHTSSLSSSGESMDSPPHSIRSVSGRSYTSSRSSRLYMARNVQEARIGYSSMYRQGDEPRDSFGGPIPVRAQVVNGYSTVPQGDVRGSPNDMTMPEPTFGPGDLHYNRKARRVNGGFEVLPAGTFGVLHEYQGPTGSDADIDDNLDHSIRPTRSSNKLRKKSNGHLKEDSQVYDSAIYGKAM